MAEIPNPDQRAPRPVTRLHLNRGSVNRLWRGSVIRASFLRPLISTFIATAFLWIAYTVTITAFRWPAPVRYAGFVGLLLVGLCLFWLARSLGAILFGQGLRRILIVGIVLYIVGVLFYGISAGIGHGSPRLILQSALTPGRLILGVLNDAGRSLVTVPDELLFAITGKRQPRRPAGNQWPEGEMPTPVVIMIAENGAASPLPTSPPGNQASVPESSPATDLRVGQQARISGTDGANLRVRENPSADALVVARFPAGAIITVLDGPRQADGYTWWRVQGKEGEGWCAANFLTAIP